ncbi:MAG: hypothetical protein AAF197_05825, partial [Pseudomonadota bacterium]
LDVNACVELQNPYEEQTPFSDLVINFELAGEASWGVLANKVGKHFPASLQKATLLETRDIICGAGAYNAPFTTQSTTMCDSFFASYEVGDYQSAKALFIENQSEGVAQQVENVFATEELQFKVLALVMDSICRTDKL